MFIVRLENDLLAFALTPLLRRHSDPEAVQTRSVQSHYYPEDPAMLSLHPSPPSARVSASLPAVSPRWRHAATTTSLAFPPST